MRRLLSVAAILAVALSARAQFRPHRPPPNYGMALTPGDTVAPLKARSLDGQELLVEWGAAKLTLVNFWATWCGPCRQEMPELQAIQKEHAKDGLRVLGVVVQDEATGDDIVNAARDMKVDYTLVWGGPDVEVAWHGIGIVPTTYLVDPKGKIVRKYVGTNAEEIAALKKDVADIFAGRPLGNPYLPPPDPAPTTPVRP